MLVNLRKRINPIAVVGRGDAPRGGAKPGFYVYGHRDDERLLPAGVGACPLPGSSVIVGSEKTAHFWLVLGRNVGLPVLSLHGNLETMRSAWNLEGAEMVA